MKEILLVGGGATAETASGFSPIGDFLDEGGFGWLFLMLEDDLIGDLTVFVDHVELSLFEIMSFLCTFGLSSIPFSSSWLHEDY